MATLRNDTVIRSADGQGTSAIVTASNIGSYGVATNSTYYVGTTQNIFNRASGAQTLTGVSIDGNAATVTNGLTTGNYNSYALPLTGGTMTGTITGVSDSTISFNGGTCSAASYNYILSGGNDGGNKLVVFVNGTTRTADGGVNALTIRNDGGAFVLGIASYLTSILGSSVTINGNAALTSASTLTSGNLSGTIPSGVLGNSTHYVGTTAIALNRGSASQTLTGVSIDGSSASCTGNSATATILQTARNINGTSFNGSAAITTANWGTARTLTIGSTGKSVDGSAAVSWSLAELGAAATNQTMFVGTTSIAINRASASQTLTGVSIDGSAATVTTNANLTGHITSVGNATSLGSFTSANLLAALTDETGTGANVFATSPTLVSPALGTPSSGNLANCTFPTLNQNTTGTSSNITAYTINQSVGTTNSPTFAGVTANGYYPSAGITESDIYAQSLSINAYHHGDSLTYDTFQFNAASIYETRATVAASFVSSAVGTSIFKGDRFGSMSIANTVYQARWTWSNTIGYKFFKTLYIANSTNGNSFTVTIESSGNGTTWTTIATSTAMSNWPGHSWYNYVWNNNATQGYIRITVTPTWVNAYGIDIYSMRYFCSYSLDASVRLYDWDYSRNITFPAGLTVTNTITGSVSGNAATATILATARLIGGVSFNGSADINLPGVNAGGTQNTTGSSASCTGNAATATILATARLIGGVSFNGSADINLPGVNTGGTQNTTGTSSNITAYTINQNVGTANSPTFVAVTTSTDGANHIMAGSANAEGIRMTPASSTTYPVFLRSINPGSGGEASPWIYKEQATDWGIWHNNPINTLDFTRATGTGIANNVGGSSTNTVVVRLDMATGTIQTSAGYLNRTGTTILDNSGNITGNAATVTNGVYTGTNNTLTGINTIYNTSNTVINNQSGNLGLTMYQATAGTDAYMTFHIGSDFAAYFGLGGAENDLIYGGWSVGNFRYRILHSSNAPYAWNMNQYVRTTDSPTFASLLITSEISISKNNPRNLLIQGSGGSDSGLLGRGSSGQFAFQLYGSGGGDYGFLDGAWAGWDIRKTVDGNLYLNDNTTYYLNPASTTNLLSLTVANTISGSITGNAGGSSASCTGNAASSTVSTYVSSLGSNINYEPYNGSRTAITKTNGLSHYTGYSGGTNRPTTYDYTLQVTNGSSGWEISMDWISLAGPAIFARSLRDCCQGWSAWVRILDSVNYSYAAAMNQNVGTANSPTFAGLTLSPSATSQFQLNSPSATQGLWIRSGYDTDGTATPVASANNIEIQSSGASSGTFSFVCGNTKILTIAPGAVNSLVALQQSGNQVLHAGNVATYALPIGGGTLTGGLSGTTGAFSSDLSSVGNYQIRNGDPTITFRDTDHRTAYIHVNSNIFHILSGVADSAFGNWNIVANGRWPLEINLSNNNATFGADVNAISFTGSGSGLTGTATSLSIGGNAATATSSPFLSALASYVWDASTLPNGFNLGIQSSFVQGSQGWPSYGSIVNVRAYSGGGSALQMYVPYSPSYGGTGMQVRFGNYDVSSGNSWTAWKTLLASDNVASYALPIGGGTLTGALNGTTASFSGVVDATQFRDSNDVAYFLDPAGTSNLNQWTTATAVRIGRSKFWTNRATYDSATGYHTGTNGWGTNEGTWANAWKGGFSGWDIWGYDTDHPQGAGYIHAQGIVSGIHYSTDTGSNAYGWMMVGATNATDNRYWLRGKWNTSISGWVEMLTSGNYNSFSPTLTGTGASGNWAINATNITAYTINQSVGTANTPTFSELTLSGTGIGAYNHLKYGGIRTSGDWQTFTNTQGQINIIEVQNITGGGYTNNPTGVYTYGAVMSWRTSSHSFQLYASHTGDLAFKTQWGNDNYSGWRRILDSGNYPYAASMNQHVGTADSVTHNYVDATQFRDIDNTAYYLEAANSTTSLLVAGKVGIRTTSPATNLHVVGSSGAARNVQLAGTTGLGSVFQQNNTVAALSRPAITLRNTTLGDVSSIDRGVGIQFDLGYGGDNLDNVGTRVSSGYITLAQESNADWTVTANRHSYITFATISAGTVAERMRISSVGNVTINGSVTAPSFVGDLSGTASYANTAGALGTSGDYTVASLTSNGFVYSGSGAGSSGAFYFNTSGHGIRRASGTNDVYCYTTSGTLYLGAGGSSTTHVRVTSGGDVGIGVSPSYKLDVNGNIHAISFPASSDIRFKKNITPLENSLEKVKKLQGVKYEWNEFVNSVRDGYKLNVPIIGLIAQDVEKIVPEIIELWKLSDDCQDARSIDYPRLIPILIEAIKEQQIIIENQNQKIENLISRVSALETK